MCGVLGVALNVALSGAAYAANPSASDKTFMENTAMASMTEIKLGAIAEKNSTNKDVLNFGQKMVSDHTKASAKLKKIATDDKVTLPSALDSKHQEVVDRLTKEKGAAFDKDYMAQMLDDHKGVVASIESEEKTAAGALKSWCEETLPVVKGHLKMAEDWKSTGK